MCLAVNRARLPPNLASPPLRGTVPALALVLSLPSRALALVALGCRFLPLAPAPALGLPRHLTSPHPSVAWLAIGSSLQTWPPHQGLSMADPP